MAPTHIETHPAPSVFKLAVTFAILFAAYQAGEGLAIRILHSDALLIALRLGFLPLAWICARALGFGGLDAWYMGRTPGWAKLFAASFALAILVKVGALGIGAKIGVYQAGPIQSIEWTGLLTGALLLLPYTFLPAVAEDIITRGFLMRALSALSWRWTFVVVSAGLFVLNHIYRLGDGPAEWSRLFAMGLAYAAALYVTRSLWPAIGLHMGWNFMGLLADRVAPMGAAVPAHGVLMTVAAHLVMLAVVVLAGRRLAPDPALKLQN